MGRKRPCEGERLQLYPAEAVNNSARTGIRFKPCRSRALVFLKKGNNEPVKASLTEGQRLVPACLGQPDYLTDPGSGIGSVK
jgi:hypothetical protein